jgi:hypothetical protein
MGGMNHGRSQRTRPEAVLGVEGPTITLAVFMV